MSPASLKNPVDFHRRIQVFILHEFLQVHVLNWDLRSLRNFPLSEDERENKVCTVKLKHPSDV